MMVYYPTTWQGWALLFGAMAVGVAGMSWWSSYKEKKSKSWPKTFKSKSGQRYIFSNFDELHNTALAGITGNVDYNAKSWPYGVTILFNEIKFLIDCKGGNRPDETWIREYISAIVQRGGNLNPDVRVDGELVSLYKYAIANGDATVARILGEHGAR